MRSAAPAPARLGGVLVLALGCLGLLAPARFVAMVGPMQLPPIVYLAAVIRLAVGVAFVRAAPLARARIPLTILGAAVAVGGVLTPIFYEQMSRPILDAWSRGGAPVVRLWGAAAIVLAGFILWALTPKRMVPGK